MSRVGHVKNVTFMMLQVMHRGEDWTLVHPLE